MAELSTLEEAIRDLVQDGSQVALEGFTHLIPFAAGHEIMRQRKRDLTVVRMTPDLVYDQMIGAGCVSKMVFPGWEPRCRIPSSLSRRRRNGFPQPLEIEEHSHAGMAAEIRGRSLDASRSVSSADTLGSDLAERARGGHRLLPFHRRLACGTGTRPADVTIIHAQQADTKGNIGLWGITGVQKEAVLAARTVIVTVEEIVDQLVDTRGRIPSCIPGWTVDAVACVSRGPYPSYAMGYTDRDNSFYRSWDAISRDRGVFRALARGVCL